MIRPVTASGRPVKGYTITDEGMAVTCSDGSLSAVDDGIAECGASAAYLPACWKSTDNTVLCLRNAAKKTLVREKLDGSWGAPKKVSTPAPLNMRLADGDNCQIRIGGAWGQVPQHPSWVGFASCTRADIYGPPNGDGIDHTTKSWTVQLYNETSGSLRTGHVLVAYLVGTAAD